MRSTASINSKIRYSKRAIDELIGHPLRKRIVDHLDDSPGLTVRQLSEALNAYRQTVKYHVDRLWNFGLIEVRPREGSRENIYFTGKNINIWDNQSTRILFGSDTTSKVVKMVVERSGATLQELVESLGVSQETVRRQVDVLAERGLVERVKVGRRAIIYPAGVLESYIHHITGKAEHAEDPETDSQVASGRYREYLENLDDSASFKWHVSVQMHGPLP